MNFEQSNTAQKFFIVAVVGRQRKERKKDRENRLRTMCSNRAELLGQAKYTYEIMKTMGSPDHHDNGFVSNYAMGQL